MKNVLITGASRGIGFETAKKFLAEGYGVIGTSTSGHIDLSHENFQALPLDLSDPQSIQNLGSSLKNSVDILINNAGILLESGENPNLEIELLRKTFEVNVFGCIDISEMMIPHMGPGSHIVNLTSSWGAFSESYISQYQPAYKMSKAAMNMYTNVLAQRLMENNITVSSVDPGWCHTDMGTQHAPKNPSDAAHEIFEVATNPDTPTGKFWKEGQQRDW